jgi:hypothetical protein
MSKLVLLFCSLLHLALGDLPVHCEMESIVGEWTFWTSRVNDFNLVPHLPIQMDGSKFCSGSAGKPTMSSNLMSTQKDSISQMNGFDDSFTVGLSLTQRVHEIPPTSATGEYDPHDLVAYTKGGVSGRWSMIFDEGFEVRSGSRSYLAISKYTCDADTPKAWCQSDEGAHENTDGSVSGWTPMCSETFVGWYHEVDESTGQITGLGCWFGKRKPGPAPKYLTEPLSISFAESSRLRRKHGNLGPDEVYNSCDIDEGVENVVDINSIPRNFNWRDQFQSFGWDSPITVQGDCGSCYSVAAVYALQARANLLLAKEGIKDPIKLSVQSIVSCSWYNQGCNGGLEMLVHRHAKEAGIPSSPSCVNYVSGQTGKTGTCDASCYQDESELVFAKDYGYVGGFNGQCSEARLLRNLYEYGPLTVAVNVANARVGSLDGIPGQRAKGRGDTDTLAIKLKSESGMASILNMISTDSELFPFLSGHPAEASKDDKTGFLFVRASVVNKDLKKLADVIGTSLKSRGYTGVNMTDAFTLGIHGWENIDHSIVLIGYGQKPDGSKFWSIRNSWGGYSEYGAFADLDRGNDLGAIESGAVWVQPDPCRGKLRKILLAHGKLSNYC